MTLKVARKLVAWQAKRVSENSWKKILSNGRVNPRLVESVLFNNSNSKVLQLARVYFEKRVLKGDKRALGVLVRASDESVNKNVESRQVAVWVLGNLAGEGVVGVLPGLLNAIKDSDYLVKRSAVWGLKNLAGEGVVDVLPVLLNAVKDSDAEVRRNAVFGLESLAKKGIVEAKKALEGLRK
jgi:hypothetical protein